MKRTRPAVLVVLAGLTLALLGAGQPALGRDEDPHGSSGIGDPYFPLDGNGGIDVTHYDIHDRYSLATGRLSGRTRVTLEATGDLSGFNLDFLLPVSSVTVDGRRVGYHRTAHELVIDKRMRTGRVYAVVVRYAGKPGAHSYDGESNWLANSHEVVAMNEPHMAPWWFPANDHPRDKALMRISINVPKSEKVIANGRRVSRTVHGERAVTTWQAAEPMAPYLAFFAAGRFTVAQGTHAGLPWYVAVSKLLPTAAQTSTMSMMKRTPTIVSWLADQLGDYPFSTTGGLVTSLDPGFALENQTRPTYTSAGASDRLTVVHELAHQWFGDFVTVAWWRDIWLNEGAASFMEDYYTETHGGPSANTQLHNVYDNRDADDAFWDLEVADPCPSHTGCVNRIFDNRVYQRGALALQALRNVLGDTVFWTVLRTWLTDHANGAGSTSVFQNLAEEVSGQELSGFFDAWFYSATKPADTVANGLG
jgi:aminopeptidase N